MQKTFINNLRFRRLTSGNESPSEDKLFNYNEFTVQSKQISNLKSQILAIAIFLYYFIQSGTLGLIPEKFYIIYRSMRISDFILYALVLYSLIHLKEYKIYFNSKPMIIVKVILAYLIFEFFVSAIRYNFNVIEFFFRLKWVWASFLIFPYLLLLSRNGFPFLIKIMFPAAVISNVLYILTALTGIPFLPDVVIYKQWLPGDLEVYRVYGGTFFGEMFYFGFVYFWITRKFKLWQVLFSVLFLMPHIFAFGRTAWAGAVFTVLFMIMMYSLKKKRFVIMFRQVIILIVMIVSLGVSFIIFIPQSDYYIDALKSRVFQSSDEVKYSEGTYGTRTIMQNEALLYLWSKSDIFIGIGMHPMWVVEPASREEVVYYSAFSDVVWPSILAAYGLIGFALASIFQLSYIYYCFKVYKRARDTSLLTLFILLLLAKLLFDSLIAWSYILFSMTLWGFFVGMSIYIPILVYEYENQRRESLIKKQSIRVNKNT